MQQNDPWAAFNPQPAGQGAPMLGNPAVQPLTPGVPKQPTAPTGFHPTDGGGLAITPGGPADPNTPQPTQAPPSPQQQANTNLDNIANLRKEFNALPAVKDYGQTLQAIGSMWRAPNNAQGDLAVVYAFAKAMDPGSVVREGEMDMANSTSSYVQDLYRKFGQITDGNRLPASVRNQLIETAAQKGVALDGAYNQERARYRQIAGQHQFDPQEVIGPHLGDAYQATAAQFRAKMGQGAPKPNYEDVDFSGKKGPTNPLSKEQQAAYDAFTAANPKATAEQLSGFFKSLGMQLDPENAKAMQEAAAKGLPFRPGSEAQFKPDISQIRPEGTGKDMVLDPALRGLVDVPTMGFSEELAAGVDSLTNGVPYNQALAFENAVRDFDQQNNFGPRLGGQLAGGSVLPTFGANSIRGLAGVGAGYGGAYGFGSTDGSFGDRSVGGLAGAAGGAATATAVGAASPFIAKGAQAVGRHIAGPTSPKQNALLTAAAQEGVPVNVADVFPGSRNTVATLESIPGSAGPVQKGIEAGRDAMEGRVQDLARGGTPNKNLGETLQEAGKRRLDKGREQATRLYNRARSLAGDAPIKAVEVNKVVSSLVAREDETPGGTRAGAIIKQYADALSSGKDITIDGARRMRSELLSRLRQDGGLSKREATHVTGLIMDGVSKDIETSLNKAGKGAAVQAYKFADKFYAQRMDEVGNIIEKLIGTDANRKGAGDTLAALNKLTGARGDTGRLAGTLKMLSNEERKDLAATLVEPLGRASADEPFSPAKFIQNVRNLNPAARRLIFGADGEKSIQNLVRIGNAKKDTVARLNNSRSGQVTNYRAVLSNLLFSLPGGGALVGAGTALNGPTGAVGGAAIGAGILAGSRQLAKALMNEEFTRAIANAPATMAPKAIDAHIGVLKKIGTRDPNVRSVVEGLEKKLLQYANDNLNTRAAASESDQKRKDEE